MNEQRDLIRIGRVMMADPDARHFVYRIWRESKVNSGQIYRLLYRMVDQGWADRGKEEQQQATRRGKKLEPRRYYVLTGKGKENLEPSWPGQART